MSNELSASTTPTSTPVVDVTPPVTPTPAAAPAAAPVAPVTPQEPVAGSWTEALKKINIIEVGMAVLGVTALYHLIYYYRYTLPANRTFHTEVRNKIDDMEMKVADVSSSHAAQQAASKPDGLFK